MLLDDASPDPYWLDRPRPAEAPPLEGVVEADLAIVGGGFTGLWAAVQAKQEQPSREVVLLEAETAGWGASGRNGGFVDASLTHGLWNGAARFPQELDALEELGRANLEGMKADLERHRIDAAWQETGQLSVATQPHELGELDEEVALLRRYGWEAEVLDREAVRAAVDSPTYLGGVLQRTGVALVDPGALALGLRRTALALGVRLYERTPVLDAELRTPGGQRARRPRPARHRRLSPAHALDPAPRGAGLRLRRRHRAAERRAAARDRLGARAGHRRPRQPLPLLPAHARRADPVRRLRGRLPLRQPRRRPRG